MTVAAFERAVARGMTEEQWLSQVIQTARLCGWRIYHARPARTSQGWRTLTQGDVGWPDLALVRAGRMVFAELKSERGRLSTEQEAWLTQLRATGAEVYVWRPSDRDSVLEVLG